VGKISGQSHARGLFLSSEKEASKENFLTTTGKEKWVLGFEIEKSVTFLVQVKSGATIWEDWRGNRVRKDAQKTTSLLLLKEEEMKSTGLVVLTQRTE